MALPVSGGSETQSATQNPQSVGQVSAGGTKSSSLQPGTPAGVLNGQGNIPLYNPVLPSVQLPSLHKTTTTAAAPSPPARHHVNGVFLGFVIVLVLIAAAMTWSINRSVKNTT